MQHDWMNDSDQVIKPSANETQEAMRWLPAGVKHLFRKVTPTTHLEREPAVIVAWMEEHDLVHTPKKGENAGHKIFTSLGKKVHSGMQRRMKGQEGT